ncbi:hypothetical protein BC834DRAFT_970154 [Gloeopeniophorella convolvens]|nr:hypothetical protein BC834DRAFT_970154 [Gloeopeniophorella convolvens]
MFEILAENMFLFYDLDRNTLYIASSPAGGEGSMQAICYLFLPALRQDAYLELVDSDMEPSSWFLPSKTSASDSCQTPQRTPFHSLPDDRMISFGAHYRRHALRVLVPRKKLLAFMRLDTGHHDQKPQVPWDLWGPKSAHVVIMDSLTFDKVVGQRWFFEDVQGIAVRDFHPLRVREAAARFGSASESIQENGCTIKVVLEPITVAFHGETFAKDVVSALPYVETRFPIPSKGRQDTVGIAVDDERIVHVVDKVTEGVTQRWIHIYSFV